MGKISPPKKPFKRMNPEYKALWLEALRSGDYEQGHGSLCAVSSAGKKTHCCLGVLEEILVSRGVARPLQMNGPVGPPARVSSKQLYLRRTSANLVGLTFISGADNDHSEKAQSVLGSLNDTRDYSEDTGSLLMQHKYTFGDIANYIEENL